MKIKKIHARQILDSRGHPTVEADVILEDGSRGRAAVPSGASTGINEALELRDNDPTSHRGKSVFKAIENVNTAIAKKLTGADAFDQAKIDSALIELDGTENKSKLGANAILAVSLAVAQAVAVSKKIPFFQRLRSLSKSPKKYLMPVPQMNIMNGGKHGGWSTDIQEYMIVPIGARSVVEALKLGTEVFHCLGDILRKKGYSTNVGDEGGYAPHYKQSLRADALRKGNEEPLELMSLAVKMAGLKLGKDIYFALDPAASEFFKNGKYHLKKEKKILNSSGLIDWYKKLIKHYPIISIEDGLDQNDWDGWINFTKALGDKIQIVGDDLFVTNLKFLKKGIEVKAANSILIKLNQIGTLTETIKAVEFAQGNGWNTIVSHRSGETEDTTIAHLSVALATGQIKSGSLCRTDRVCKYNELMRIEEILGKSAKYAGKDIFKKWLN